MHISMCIHLFTVRCIHVDINIQGPCAKKMYRNRPRIDTWIGVLSWPRFTQLALRQIPEYLHWPM